MALTVVLLARILAIAVLLRIGWTDLTTQKIANNDVLALATCGLAASIAASYRQNSWASLAIGLGAAAMLLAVLFPFWMLGKLGAGDVKLIAVVPILVSSDQYLVFALALLIFVLAIVVLVRNPLFLPHQLFGEYLKVMGRRGVVPFGVPISAALIVVLGSGLVTTSM